jgi:hypothetical protein
LTSQSNAYLNAELVPKTLRMVFPVLPHWPLLTATSKIITRSDITKKERKKKKSKFWATTKESRTGSLKRENLLLLFLFEHLRRLLILSCSFWEIRFSFKKSNFRHYDLPEVPEKLFLGLYGVPYGLIVEESIASKLNLPPPLKN